MAYWNPEGAFDTLKDRISTSVQSYFPIVGNKQTLKANKVWVDDNLHVDDIRGQKEAKVTKRSWTVPVRAEVELVDNSTGKVRDRQTVTVAQLPKITRRYSYIVNGTEKQINNLFRLKSGVYTRERANGEISSQWNLVKGLGFEMNFDPKTKKMTMSYAQGANVPLYPMLKTMGVSDDDIERRWGKEVLTANMKDKEDVALRKFYRMFKAGPAPTTDEAKKFVVEELGKTELRPDSTQVTLGKPFDKVSGSALLEGSHRILKVSRGEEEEDDRDSLAFKELWSTEDLLADRMDRRARFDITRKLKNAVDKPGRVRSMINPEIIGKPIRSFFTNSAVSERPEQMNPISFTSGNRRTTIMAPGVGGISTAHQVSLEARAINPSHMGFLDPIQTPESERVGVNLQLASGVRKVGRDLEIKAYNTKTGKGEWITPAKALTSTLAFPDQYEWKGGKPRPLNDYVKITDRKGDIVKAKPSEVEYILPSTKAMFDLSANLVPFLQSNQGNRAMVASKQLEQAVPLKHREQPLVQVRGDSSTTFEKAIGDFNSHRSPVEGVVKQVKKDAVIVEDKKGDRHEIQVYHDFPLNDSRSVLNSDVKVKAGDKVKAGQLVADSNFTRDGVLSLGTTLRVAYMPWRGYNFEDGVVISESAAKKLTSEHMHRDSVMAEKNILLDKQKFLAETAGTTTKEQAEKLDDDGVIKPGQTVMPGDVLIGVLRKDEVRPEAQMLSLFSKKLIRPVRPRPVLWTKDVPGVVNEVVKHGKLTTVYIKTEMPADVGDKIVGRHGNKGIVTAVIPDQEMPHTADGTPMEVLLNPAGVPGRINLGQILETAASKIARKTNKPYVVNNFDPTVKDYTRALMKDMEAHGVKDTEDLIDPLTNQKRTAVLTGEQYILKLHHMADKGLQARSRDAYDSNLTPKEGGPRGGQTMDALGMYALLAHNARENIREFQSYKSDFNEGFWNALQAGEPIPPPKVPFVFNKFEGYLKAMGVNVRKDGNSLILAPLTDKQVVGDRKTPGLSNGEIREPHRMIRAKDARPEEGGLFDPKITGTEWPNGKLGDKWAHITLREKMPNPIFEKPISALLGLSSTSYDNIIAGKETLDGKTGPEAIVRAVSKIDVEKELPRLKAELPNLHGTELNRLNKKVKYLQALKRAELKPEEAYTTQHLPVLPPIMRPLTILDNGDLKYDDVNGIYKAIGALNDQMKRFDPALPDEEKQPIQAALYNGLKGLSLTGLNFQGRHHSGIAETIAGPGSVKEGYFHKRVIGRHQDLSMRGTIVPEPSLSLDEVAIPRKAATEIYKPFVVRRLRRMDYSPLEAQQHIAQGTPLAKEALKAEIEQRPLLLKRDPVLHRYGVQAFKPVLVEGKAIKIHPLVTSGYNADFDGDKMSAYVPVSQKAVDEAFKMLPSNNLFSPATGKIMYVPKQEAMLGLFKLTEMGKDSHRSFKTAAEAAKAVRDGELAINDTISLGGTAGDVFNSLIKTSAPTKTTVGRLLLYQSMPESMKDPKILSDPAFVMDKKVLEAVLNDVGAKSPKDYGRVADRFKDMGNTMATGTSIGLQDFLSYNKTRDKMFEAANHEERRIRTSVLSPEKKKEKVLELYMGLSKKIDDEMPKEVAKSNNRMYDWVRSGARGSWDQFKQMVVSPVLLADNKGRPVPVPIDKSYSEGLDVASYWTAMHGARMGTIGKVQGTQEPGKFTKQVMNVAMNQIVASPDCGTQRGILMPIDDRDIMGRFTTSDIHLNPRGRKDKGVIPAGTLIDTHVANRLRNSRVDEVMVRSPLRCVHGRGVCSKCYGLNEKGQLYDEGTNVGVMATQALGEPATQLAMRVFHTGGVVGARGTSFAKDFNHVQNLVNLPEKVPGQATLAATDGKVTKIEKDEATGGWNVYVGANRHFVPARRELTAQVGQSVRTGDSLSSGPKNPIELLQLTRNLLAVQTYLTNELHDAYKKDGPVRRRNMETFVRSMTNMAKVVDPGDHDSWLPGDSVYMTEVQAFNAALPKGKKPVIADSVLKGVQMLPLELQTDWLARMNVGYLKKGLVDAAAEGWVSNIHSEHPIPGMAYAKEFGTGTPDKPYLY